MQSFGVLRMICTDSEQPTKNHRRVNIMKLQAIILLGIMLFGAVAANAQSDNNAKDLYYGERPRTNRQTTTTTTAIATTRRTTTTPTRRTTRTRTTRRRAPARRTYNRRSRIRRSSSVSPTPIGLPGTKITIELNRNGKLSFVKPNYQFRSGDKIRLRMKTNFEGYVTVLNLGSSGNVNLLYPVAGKPHYVTPTNDYQIPQGNGWVVFDDQPGIEIISVIMSEYELGNFADLNKNSRYFTKDRTSKDLFVQTTDEEQRPTYVVFRPQEEGENVGFTLNLRHRK